MNVFIRTPIWFADILGNTGINKERESCLGAHFLMRSMSYNVLDRFKRRTGILPKESWYVYLQLFSVVQTLT
jgi:hypothetical protein